MALSSWVMVSWGRLREREDEFEVVEEVLEVEEVVVVAVVVEEEVVEAEEWEYFL